MSSWAVIPSQIPNEDSEHLDAEDLEAISSEGSRESRKLTSFGLNLKSAPFWSLGAPWYRKVWFFWTHSKMEALTSWRIQGVMAILCRSTSVNTALIRFQLITHHCSQCCFTFNRTVFKKSFQSPKIHVECWICFRTHQTPQELLLHSNG